MLQARRPEEIAGAHVACRLLLSALACACGAPSDDSPGGYGSQWTTPAPPTGTTTPAPGSTTPPPAGTATTSPGSTTTPPPTMGVPVAPPEMGDPGDVTGSGGAMAEPTPTMTAGGAAPMPREDLGEGDGSDVITIGDSWMNYLLSGGGIEGALRRAGKTYRGYGVAGTLLLNGQIPGQYDRAKSANPDISTVIMTGGGNDIMFSGGCNTPEACEQSLMALVDGLNELWTEMAADGVKDVIYIRYSAGAGTTPTSMLPTEPPPPPAICLAGTIKCHSLNTTDLVMGRLLDGIHPTSAANDSIAMGLLELMETQGVRR